MRPCRLGAITLFAIALAGIPTSLRAQPQDWRSFDLDLHYRVSVHRTLGFVSAITQTPDGYIWFATGFGLARYDGVQLAFFDSSNTSEFTDDHITDLVLDGTAGMWVATQSGGILYFAGGKFVSLPMQGFPPDAQIASLRQDDNGALWVSTGRHGLHHFDGQTWTHATEAGNEAGRAVVGYDRSLLYEVDGVWWRVKGGRLTREPPILTTQSGRTKFIVSQVLPPSLPPVSSSLYDEIRGQQLQSSAVPGDGSVWLGSGFLKRIARGRSRSFGINEGVANANILSIFQDRESNIWAGHYGTGLTQMTRVPFATFSGQEGFGGGAAFSFAQTSDSTIWISQSTGLTEVRGDKFRNWPSSGRFATWSVRSLAVAHDDSLWMILLDKGIGHMVNGEIAVLDAPRKSQNPELTALMFSKSHQLWSASALGGLVTLRDGTLQEVAVPELGLIGCLGPVTSDFPCPHSVNVLVPAQDGGMWMGTAGRGLWKRTAAGTSTQMPGDALALAFIFDVLEQDAGTVWVATDHGLFLIRDGIAHTFTRKEGLISDGTFCVLDDGQGRLWLCSERGVASVGKSDFEAVLGGKATRVDPVSFRALDGLPSDEFIRRFEKTALRARDGRLWFSAVGGVAVFQAPGSVPVPPLAVALIERMVLKRNVFTPPFPNQLVAIGPGQGDLEFNYTAPAFTAPHRLSFRYKLEGFDGAWVNAGGRRSAFYTNIPPGQYTFKVVAETPGAGTSTAFATFPFVLRPLFYQTIWFYFALGAAALLAGFAAQRLRIRAVRAKFQTVLDERNRISADLHDTLAQVFSAIGFQIDSVIGLVSQGQPLPKERLKRVRQMVAHARLAARSVIWNLRQTEGAESSIQSLITKLEAIPSLYDSVRIVVNGTDTRRALPVVVENELFHIAQEAVSNAVEHGKAGLISLELEIAGDRLELLIHDNGVGFEPRGPEQAGEPRFGLRGMRERASRIGAEMTMHTEPEVGTEVSVKVRLGANKGAGSP